MVRVLLLVSLATVTALGVQTSPEGPTVTFNKDVLPLLQENCQTCHHPDGIAPMSLMTYEDARPWAKAIKARVVTRQMPPWFADSGFAKLRNEPHLTDADIRVISAWAESGAREGDVIEKPPQGREYPNGWRTPPDVVVSMPYAYPIGATGVGEIRRFLIPSPFDEDTWVTSIEVRPGDPSVVHHAIVQISDIVMPPTKVVATPDGIMVETTVVDEPGRTDSGYANLFPSGPGTFTTMDAVYAPGAQPLNFGYTNTAKRIPGRKAIRLEVHYTPNGKATTDQTMVGFTLAKAPVKRHFVIMAPEHLGDTRKPIPAGAENWQSTGELKFKQDVDLVWFMPHMHLRGKDMTYQLIYPDGRKETVLSAKFNFHWQRGYELENPIHVPKGSRLVITAHHDNSQNNRYNPDAKHEVQWGDMTSQEMMVPWFGVIVDRDEKPSDIASYKQKGFEPNNPGQSSSCNTGCLIIQ
jgi:hypothetical protein